ncbi:MAG: transcriptional regulator [Anaerolineae bacterium]|nr:winged helix-turn-helix transcriptional regulator [Anaerolineales bacterium]MCQ3973538.1 transcriptional regulator [Anaerolineae bacterium]
MTATPPASRVLDALGNQTRRDILALLSQSPLTVGSIAAHLPISRPAVSKHLRILEEAGLVAYQSSGARNIFYLNPAGFQEARAYLELFWDEALSNFKRAAEETEQGNDNL